MRTVPRILSLLMVCAMSLGAHGADSATKAADKGSDKVVAKPAARALYEPDLSKWKLEITPELGGWTLNGKQEIRIKMVDPQDPNPPKDDAQRVSEYEGDEYYEGDSDLNSNKTAEQLKQERLIREEEARNNAWRSRTLHIWCNGDTVQRSTEVGHSTYFEVDSQNGENRLEIWEEDSGKRLVRTWWANGSRSRLRINALAKGENEWSSGRLEVLEPNGDLASQGRRTNSGGTLSWSGEYLHPTPPMGTYTLRWTGGYRGGAPFKVVLEAILDGGTEQEKRWVFERLILPGAGPVTLGTLDVEN